MSLKVKKQRFCLTHVDICQFTEHSVKSGYCPLRSRGLEITMWFIGFCPPMRRQILVQF